MKKHGNVTVRNAGETRTWEDYRKAFLNLLPKVSPSYDLRSIFCDACRIFCLSFRGVIATGKEKDEIEREYQTFVEKYGNDGMQKISILLSYVVQALELRRSDFLGHVQEGLNATRGKDAGQFYTPDSVSIMMARMCARGHQIKPGKIIKIGDPSCGAGALLIAGVEALMEAGVRQGDVLVCGEDLDPTACNIFYVQATLLGYAAIVTRMDSLSMQVYEGPWYTMGYFAHCMPMRRLCEDVKAETSEEQPPQEKKPEDPVKEINVRELVQGEFDF